MVFERYFRPNFESIGNAIICIQNLNSNLLHRGSALFGGGIHILIPEQYSVAFVSGFVIEVVHPQMQITA